MAKKTKKKTINKTEQNKDSQYKAAPLVNKLLIS